MWSFIYVFLESVQSGSFQISQNGTGDQGHFIYFSFITMTTVGYGDTTPISNAEPSLSVLEAVMGSSISLSQLPDWQGYISRRGCKIAKDE
jgi:hypothetical protein